ncbi:MAG: acyltransferase [Bacteroidales bacterium]|nr:acyltransferase [Bacteroidales bacterium]
MSSQPIPLSAKPRFEILDGLRGVAAMIVVAFHLFETYSAGPSHQILNHGYLAVDFFFVLSGFVIGYAYDDRWKSGAMTTWNFFQRRLIRLQPMVILGTLIGAFWFYFSAAPGFELVMQTPWWKLLIIMILGCIMFPTPPSMDIRGWQEINSLNGAQWSLMWEYVANILYALFVRRFSRLMLAVFVTLSAFLTIDLALNLDVTGLLAVRQYAKYTVIGGFGLTPDQIYIGICRLLYPFFGGLLLYRMSRWRICLKRGGMTWCSLAVAATLVIPHIGGEDQAWLNGLYCAAVILVIYPLVVAAGAGSPLKGARTTALCRFLGMISYPLYITHYPMIYVQMNWAARHPDAPLGTHIWVAVSIFIASVAIAYASVKVYDIPIRNWLSERFLHPAKKRS